MDQNERLQTALMRYSAIAPVITGQAGSFDSETAYFRDVSEKGIRSPSGELRHYSVDTMQRWLYGYRKGGFDALMPKPRNDSGKLRKVDSETFERIKYYHTAYPRMPAAAVYRRLLEDGTILPGQLSESSVLRCVSLVDTAEGTTVSKDMHRYERPHINEVWCGDTCYGPGLKTSDGKKRRVYIIALIDDASRFVVGADVFFSDSFESLMAVLKSAVLKHGIPRVLNFDNGASFKNLQMDLLAARMGSVVHHCHPYSPTEKSKIERWFRTLRDHWLASLDMSDFHSLEELRGSLHSYVNSYNRTVHSSLSGKTPSDRFFSESDLIRRLPEDTADKTFLLEIERRVSADNVIVIGQVEYEVPARFAKQRIKLRYSPDMEEIYVVEQDGAVLTPIKLLNKTDNSMMKRERVFLTGGLHDD